MRRRFRFTNTNANDDEWLLWCLRTCVLPRNRWVVRKHLLLRCISALLSQKGVKNSVMLSGAELVLLAVAALLLAAVCESILAAQKSAAEQKPERPTKEATLSYVVLEEDDNNNSDNRGYVWMPDENASCRHFILVAIAYMVAIAEAIDWLALGDDTGYFSFFRVLVYLLLGIGAELDHSPFHRNGAVQGRARVRALAAFLLSLDRLAPWYVLE